MTIPPNIHSAKIKTNSSNSGDSKRAKAIRARYFITTIHPTIIDVPNLIINGIIIYSSSSSLMLSVDGNSTENVDSVFLGLLDVLRVERGLVKGFVAQPSP
jgi:hypothetical protein